MSHFLSAKTIIGTVIKATAWDKRIVKIKGKEPTLNDVEHKIIRPQFKDPRAHFALVCASKSCPQLRSEAFEAARLEDRLDDQARKFLSDPFRNEFETESPITMNLDNDSSRKSACRSERCPTRSGPVVWGS